ncbi:hypothetical protein Fcan01_25265 [Folsomia candida]|uniref:F-box domain-containing protein n=1 Tax=Folsomia candida TaxID=158441 RepID=A0A226D556_FOLCA|nr:hypothetical protein Fcan01_25265 [Folsomia candida]
MVENIGIAGMRSSCNTSLLICDLEVPVTTNSGGGNEVVSMSEGAVIRQSWKQFAILPYQDGRKFTLGTKYTSREEQGEFIFLHIEGDDDEGGNDDKNVNTASLVEIFCNNGQFYIMPNSGVELLINNDPEGRYRLELNFGDRLEISWHDEVLQLLFKERTFKPDNHNWYGKRGPGEVVPMGDINFTPEKNQLILSKILSYLPLQSLKCARLVCKDWNEEGSRLLRNTGFATFNNEHDYGNYIQDVNASMKFLQYMEEMQNMPMHNWRLYIPIFELHPVRYPESILDSVFSILPHKPGDKYVADLTWFLHLDRGHHIKRLKLHGRIFSNFDYKIFLKVVTALQTTLQELYLRLYFYSDEEYQPEGNLHFKKLKVFSFNFEHNRDLDPLNHAYLAPWAPAIVEAESIAISGCPVMTSILMKSLQEIGPLSFPKLTEFKMTLFSRRAQPSLGLDFLLGLKQPLNSLSVSELLRMEDFRKFENLVEKNAGSLENLVVTVSTQVDAKTGLKLQLPALPKLRDLFFDVERGLDYDKYGKSEAKVGLKFPGDTGIVKYKAHLPSIRSMRLFPIDEFEDSVSWEDCGDFFDTFLPKKDAASLDQQEVCKTLKILDIPYEIGDKTKIPFPRGAELAVMFPNVENKFMAEFRNNHPKLATQMGVIEKMN